MYHFLAGRQRQRIPRLRRFVKKKKSAQTATLLSLYDFFSAAAHDELLLVHLLVFIVFVCCSLSFASTGPLVLARLATSGVCFVSAERRGGWKTQASHNQF